MLWEQSGFGYFPNAHHSGVVCYCLFCVCHYFLIPFILDWKQKRRALWKTIDTPNTQKGNTNTPKELQHPCKKLIKSYKKVVDFLVRLRYYKYVLKRSTDLTKGDGVLDRCLFYLFLL